MFHTSRMITTAILAAILLLAAVPAAGGQGGAAKQGKTDPAGVTLELRLKANKDTYVLDLGGKTDAEFRQAIDKALKGDGKLRAEGVVPPLPPVPVVDMTLELVNTGAKDLELQLPNGMPAGLTLELAGPGVLTFNVPSIAPGAPAVLRIVTLAPGKSLTWPIKALHYGKPEKTGQFVVPFTYWTKPGDYTLTFTGGFSVKGVNQTVRASNAPVTVKVVEKK